jgi:hypothetical protein
LGENRPIATNSTDEGRTVNRRVELITNYWEPLTDDLPSLGIGDIAISPLDADGNAVDAGTRTDKLVLYAGTGKFSSFANEGSFNVGLYKSTDGGRTWDVLAPELNGLDITAVVPTGLTDSGQEIVLVAATSEFDSSGAVINQGGIFRSTDGGQSFTQIVGGEATDLVADPGNSNRYYAGVLGQGVMVSTDGGASFNPTGGQPTLGADGADNDGDGTNDDAGETAAGATRIQLAVQQATGGSNVVFAALIDNGQLYGVFRSTNQGGAWNQVGNAAPAVNPGGQGTTHFSMAADSSGTRVFVAGDTRAAAPFVGNVFLGDSSVAPASAWTAIVLTGANGSAPHADSRDMFIDRAGRLVETDDGGIFRLSTPTSGTRTWTSLNGNLRVTEVLSLAYDPLNNIIYTGNQDNGVSEQVPPLGFPVDTDGDGIPDDAATRFNWGLVSVPFPNQPVNGNFSFSGDGNNEVAFAFDSDADGINDRVLRYTLGNNFGVFTARLFDAAGNDITPAPVSVGGNFVNGPGSLGPGNILTDFQGFLNPRGAVGLRSPLGTVATNPIGSGLDPVDQAMITNNDFNFIPYVVNAVNNSKMLLGHFSLYESSDRLETISSVLPSTLGAPRYNPSDYFSALAYGGKKGATVHEDVIYAAKGNRVFVRVAGAANPNTFQSFRIPGASQIRDIVLDPEDWEVAYAVDSNNVYKTSNHGQNWVVISDQLPAFELRSLEIVQTGPSAKTLLVGTPSGVFRTINPDVDVIWTQFGDGLANAPVRDLEFSDLAGTANDLLLAGTQGRGVWTLQGGLTATAATGSTLTVNGTSGVDAFTVRLSNANPDLLEILVNSATPTFTVALSSLERVDINGLGGNDTLTIDTTNGAIGLSDGLHFDGGNDSDTLTLTGGTFNSLSTSSSPPDTTVTIVDGTSNTTMVVVHRNVETFTNNLGEATLLEKAGDALQDFFEWLGLVGNPGEGADANLALLGGSLPRALTGSQSASGRPLSGEDGESEGAENASPAEQGWKRLIEAGTGAFDLADVGTGTLNSFEALRAALDALDGTSNVTLSNTATLNAEGTQVTAGDVHWDVHVVKRLTGNADFDASFDLFGGTVDLFGDLNLGAEITLNLRFGFDTTGFYVDTSFSSQDLVVRDIDLSGGGEATGHFGFLDIEAEVNQLTLGNDVGFKVDLQGGGGKLRLGDFGASLGGKAVATVTGDAGDDVVLRVDAEASAVVPGIDSIDLGGAQLTLTWANVTDPSTVSVAANAGLAQDLIDFLRVDVQDVLDQLSQLDQLADALDGFDVPLLQDTLSTIADAADFICEKIVYAVIGGVSGEANLGSIQDVVVRLAPFIGVDPVVLAVA